MKRFEEVLKDNHVSRNLFNRRRWNKVEEAYVALQKEVAEKNAQWEIERNRLQESWNTTFPMLSELEPMPALSFINYKEAEEQIRQLRKRNDEISVYDLERRLRREALKEWFMEILENADEDCTLIVIKAQDYTPYDDNKERFEKAVQQRKAGTIYSIFCPMWIAFNPKKECNPEEWMICKTKSTIEYVK